MGKRIKALIYLIITVCFLFDFAFLNMANVSATEAAIVTETGNFGLKNDELTKKFVTTDLTSVAGKAIKIFIGLSSTVMLIMVIWAGFDIMFSNGNAEVRKKAINRIVWTAIGIIIIISAYALSQFVINQIKFLSKTT